MLSLRKKKSHTHSLPVSRFVCLASSFFTTITKRRHFRHLCSTRAAIVIRLFENVANERNPTNGPKQYEEDNARHPSGNVRRRANLGASWLRARGTLLHPNGGATKIAVCSNSALLLSNTSTWSGNGSHKGFRLRQVARIGNGGLFGTRGVHHGLCDSLWRASSFGR